MDVWPFNLPPGPMFLWLYVLLWALLIGASFVIQYVVGGFLTGKPTSTMTGPRGVGALSAQAPETFKIGRVPKGDECFAIAYARHGREGLASAMLAAAVKDGWLVEENGVYRTLYDARVSSKVLRMLHDALRTRTNNSYPKDVYEIAREVANRLKPEIEDTLSRAGLRYTGGARLLIAMVPIACAGGLLLFAMLRIWQREAMHPNAVAPTNLMMAMVFSSLSFIVLAFATGKRTPRLSAYLRWLDDATVSLRQDVRLGRSRSVDDVALTVAHEGNTALALVGLGAVWLAIQPPPTSSSSDSSSSSCSSSSCSSSSGCGSSCGGGGGCS